MGLRAHAASAATSLLAWLPLVVLEANAPFDLPYFAASPVLRELLGLSAQVGLAAAAATAVLSSVIIVILGAGRGSVSGPAAGAVPVLHTALVIAGCPAINRWAIAVPVSERIAVTGLFLGAAVIVLGVALLLQRLAATSPLRSSGARASLVIAFGIAFCWGAAISIELSLSLTERRMLILALASIGLIAQQLRVVGRIRGEPASRVTTATVWAAGLVGPLLVTAFAPSSVTVGARSAVDLRPGDAPNVIVVMVDTLRADHTSLGSDDPEATPNLLALSREGSTYFSRAIAAGSSTAPSVKAFFTSRTPSHWGLESSNSPPPPEAWRFVESFHAAGFQTAAISANPLVERNPYSGGFDYFWSAGGYRYWQRSFLLNELFSGKRLWTVFKRVEKLDVDKIAAATVRGVASDWLDGRKPDVPFLLYLHFMDPHWPYYDRGYFEPTPRAEPGFSYVDYLALDHGNPALARLRNGRNVRHLRHTYGEEVRNVDEELGLLFEDLEQRGLMDDSIVVILGDHGEEFLEHNGFSHGHDVYEEQVHVPLLVHWPRQAQYADMPDRIEGPVSLLDLAPTLVELLGLPGAPRDLDGRSFAKRLSRTAFDGVGTTPPPPVTSESSLLGRSYVAYREGDLKARVQYDENVPPWESDDLRVVDLATDPEERVQLDEDDAEVASFLDRARGFLRTNRRQNR